MATREIYARATYSHNGVECSPGVEIREGDDIDEMTHELQSNVTYALKAWSGSRGIDHNKVINWVETAIKDRWPGRAYFIETEEEGRGVQVFSPYGLPRH